MIIRLPVKPMSVNVAWQGRRFKAKKYKAYEKDVLWRLSDHDEEVVIGQTHVNYKFYLKRWKTTDASNLIKCLQDILVKAKVIKDDRFIMRSTIEKVPSKIDRIEIEIVALEPQRRRGKR